jgi:hypothetical protein
MRPRNLKIKLSLQRNLLYRRMKDLKKVQDSLDLRQLAQPGPNNWV